MRVAARVAAFGLLLATGLLTATCGGDSPTAPAPSTPALSPAPPPPNRPPAAATQIPDVTLERDRPRTLDLGPHFADPDGDQLTFQAASSDSGVVRAVVSESELILVAVAPGKATVTVTATDPGGLSATQTFEVTVGTPNHPPVAAGEIPDQSLHRCNGENGNRAHGY